MTTDAAAPGGPQKTKVAILGGGPAGLATAFWLTATPELRAKFKVDIYTPGWRLGGKCASGRREGRILEHGLHILMGCYKYAFSTICATYNEWKPRSGSAIKTFADAFTPQYQVTLPEMNSTGAWDFWNFPLPELGPPPCERDLAAETTGGEAGKHPLADLMIRMSHDVESAALSLLGAMEAPQVSQTMHAFRDVAGGMPLNVQELIRDIDHVARQIPPEATGRPPDAAPSGATEAIPTGGWICPRQCKIVFANLGLAMMTAWLTDVWGQGPGAIDRLNETEFRAWLKKYGAWDSTLASAPIRAIYNLTFAFPNGDASDINNGSIAAGVTLRFMLEAVFGYMGAPLWKMNAGTADVVFMPMYQVLTARGVDVHFFHRVEDIALGANGKIGTISLNQQAQTLLAEYNPLVDVENLDSWPFQPLWGQLVDGDILQNGNVDFESPNEPQSTRPIPLVAGQDFDVAVLAIPPEITKHIGARLARHDPRWDAAIENSSSVATGAFQLWMKPTVPQLGWDLGTTVVTAYVPEFESWGDMSHLVPREPPSATQSIGYFCGTLKESWVPPNGEALMADWLKNNIAQLWPKGVLGNGTLDPLLVDDHVCRLNVAGSERYVLTPPGSVKYRLAPDTSIFGNLYVAGDWTVTRFSGGCFESAMESGTRAAAAIIRDYP